MGAANRLVGVMLAVLLSAPASCVSRLKNIATRGFVGTGDNVLIAGLIIEGDTRATTPRRALPRVLTRTPTTPSRKAT